MFCRTIANDEVPMKGDSVAATSVANPEPQ